MIRAHITRHTPAGHLTLGWTYTVRDTVTRLTLINRVGMPSQADALTEACRWVRSFETSDTQTF